MLLRWWLSGLLCWVSFGAMADDFIPDSVSRGGAEPNFAEQSGQIDRVLFFANDWRNYNPSDKAFMVFYMTPALPDACGSGEGRIAISADHVLYESTVSAVLAAKMAKQAVHVAYLTICEQRYNAWDFGYLRLD